MSSPNDPFRSFSGYAANVRSTASFHRSRGLRNQFGHLVWARHR
jgi:hypothetical protein